MLMIKKSVMIVLLLTTFSVQAENLMTPEWKYPADQGWYPNPYNRLSSNADKAGWRRAYETCYKQSFIQSEIKTNYQGYQSQYLFRDLYEQCMGTYGYFIVDTDASRVQYGEHYTTRGRW